MQISEKSWTRGRPLRRRGTRGVASSSPRCSSRPCPTPTPPRPSPPPAGIPLTKLVVYISAKERCSEATDTPGQGPEVPSLGQAPVVRRDAVEETVNVRKDEAEALPDADAPAAIRRPRVSLASTFDLTSKYSLPWLPPVNLQSPSAIPPTVALSPW